MKEFQIEKLLQEVEKDTYNLQLYLGIKVFVTLEQPSLEQRPRHELLIKHDQKVYHLPLLNFDSLQRSYGLLEQISTGELEVIVGTSEEVQQQTAEAIQRGKPGHFIIGLTLDLGRGFREEEKGKIIKSATSLFREHAQQTIGEHHAYLQKFCGYLTPELQSIITTRLNEATDDDRGLIRSYDQGNEDLERLEKLIDTKSMLRFVGRCSNILSLGRAERSSQTILDGYAQRLIAWRVIEYAAEKMSTHFSDEAKCLTSTEDGDLAANVRKIASFYGNLSQQAAYGNQRMKGLVDRVIAFNNSAFGLKPLPIEEVYDGIVAKAKKFTFKMGPDFSVIAL